MSKQTTKRRATVGKTPSKRRASSVPSRVKASKVAKSRASSAKPTRRSNSPTAPLSVALLSTALVHDMKHQISLIPSHFDALCHEFRIPVDHVKRGRVAYAIRGALSLMEDLLFATKGLHSPLKPNRQRAELAQIINEVLADFSEVAHQRELVLRARSGKTSISVDPQLLRRALLNLLSNAVKFSLPGGEILVNVEQRGAGAKKVTTISVSDTGVGIAPEVQRDLFEPFSSSQGLAGVGVGLWVVKVIAEAHGGSVSCESVLGQGSTFSFNIPG